MVTRSSRLMLAIGAIVVALSVGGAGSAQSRDGGAARSSPAQQAAAKRIVSLVPAVTEMLFAIGAGPRVIAVSNFDTFPAEVRALPRVGALIDPDTERILSLRPDLVVTYSSQQDVRARFERAGIRTFAYRHGGLAAMLDSVRQIGAVTGREAAAADTAKRIQQRLNELRERVRDRPRPQTLLVFERSPQTLRGIYVSGGTGFLNEMLDYAGGANVFADVKRESVQPSQEALLRRAPQVILEIRASQTLTGTDLRRDHDVWNSLLSLPAVRQRRIHFLTGSPLVVPGPRVAEGVEIMARALHPDAFR
jgi:iron complex transport system substrate-binding protein